MALVSNGWVSAEDISSRIGRLQTRYVGNPLIKRIEYHLGVDWSDDPAVFIDVTVGRDEVTTEQLLQLAQAIRGDLLRLVRSDEIGIHSYLHFVN